MHKRQLFVSKYQAYLGNWTAGANGAEAEAWWTFVDRLNEADLDELFDLVVAYRGEATAKPRIPMFRRALAEIESRRRPAPSTGATTCQRCNNTGLISVPAALPRRHLGETKVSFNERTHVLVNCSFPCGICPAGQRRRENWGEYLSEETIREANEQWALALRAGGYGEEDETPVTLSEFLGTMKDRQGVSSPVGFFAELRLESRLREAAREGEGDGELELPDLGLSEQLRRLKHKDQAKKEGK